MTRKKNNFSTDYIIRNIEDQARQRNLTDGVTQAPLWFNNPPPLIRGSDRNAGSFVGKGPKKFRFPLAAPPEQASLSWWYDSEVRGVGDVPLNQGADTYTAMSATGTPNVVQKTVGATANVDVWQQAGTTDYYESDPGSGLSNPYLVNVGEDATFVWLLSPISANSDALQPYAGNQRSNSASVLSLWDSYYVGYAGGAAVPSTWTFRFDSGVEGPTGACSDLSRFLVVVCVLKNAQINGASPGEFYDFYVRELASGSSWASRTDGVNRSETLREAHRMFYPGDHFEGCVQSWMFYKQLALSAAQRDELYDYFVDRFGEA